MPSWKKVIVSGSQAHLQGITASNLTNTPTGQIVGYNPSTGILSYFNTSSIVVATASYALTASFINPTGSNVFVQGGNSFGATAVLGTNDNHPLTFETNGTTKAVIAPSGYTKFNYATNNGEQAFGVVNTNISESLAVSGYNIWSGSNNVNDVVTGQFVYTGDNYNNDNIRQTLILGQPALGVVSNVATRPSRIAIMANTTQEPNLIGFNSASIDFIIGSKNTGRMLQIKSGSVGIGMGATELTDTTIRLRLRGSGTTSTTTALRVENSSADASLVVRNDGNVGIGTSTPTNTLQVSGSLWATTITASNIPSGSNANVLVYNSQSGEFTYLSTSSIGGNVQGTGAANYVTYWTGTNTIAGNTAFQFNPSASPRALLTLSGDIDCGNLSVGAAIPGQGNLTVNLNTTLGAAPRTASINTGRVNIPNLTEGSSELAVLVTGSDGQVFTRAIDNRVFGTSLIDGNLTANRVPFAFDANTLTDDNNFTYDSGTDVLTINGSTFGQNVTVAGNLSVNGNTTLGNAAADTASITAGRVNISNLTAGSSELAVLVTGSNGQVFTRAIDNRVFGTTLISGSGTTDRVVLWNTATSINDDADLSFNRTTNVLTIGSSTFGNDVTIAGNLTVNGDTTIINTSTLSVEDKFIVLGRSSGSQVPVSEGGIIVEGAAGSGSAFVFNSGSGGANGLANRWGVALGVGTASINVTPTDFMVTVSSSAAAPSDANPPTFGSASFGFGNMHIQDNGEIWIYS